ncbi:MAG: hypothetical protein ABJG86_18575 [Nitratireductor sp.]|uniref:hypothetical protein n=1 Tax=Alphaproteobacteria TaxID=28211 RepID=UPI003287DDA6
MDEFSNASETVLGISAIASKYALAGPSGSLCPISPIQWVSSSSEQSLSTIAKRTKSSADTYPLAQDKKWFENLTRRETSDTPKLRQTDHMVPDQNLMIDLISLTSIR